jgi:hypothetical protein
VRAAATGVEAAGEGRLATGQVKSHAREMKEM